MNIVDPGEQLQKCCYCYPGIENQLHLLFLTTPTLQGRAHSPYCLSALDTAEFVTRHLALYLLLLWRPLSAVQN